ncbi:MAG: VanW family protein [Acidimicrobiales bacterium]
MAPGASDLGAEHGGQREWPRPAVLALVAVAAVFGFVVLAWLLDSEARNGDSVQRNVTLSGRAIGGLGKRELDSVVASLGRDYASAPVDIRVPGATVKAQAPELGLSLRQDQTVAAALAVGRKGFVGGRLLGWTAGLVRPRASQAVVRVDTRSVARVLAERDPGRKPPVEPHIEVQGDRTVAAAGSPGLGVDPAAVVAALADVAPRGFPLRVAVRRTSLPPRFQLADAEKLADQAEETAARGLPIVAGSVKATLTPSTIRSLLSSEPTEDGLRLNVDASRVPAALSALLPSVGRPAVDAGFTVSAGGISITPSRTGLRCCAPQAANIIQAALLQRSIGTSATPVQLPVETVLPRRDEDDAQRLGIVEAVGSFTTNHPGGQPRVQNIHRMADTVRGAVIEPGRTFSVNDYVGPRTPAKGYLDAPVIGENQTFSTSPGGGVSQFATTLFNAAFFAGLDIPSYGMHGLYISRYPYGREATLAYPSLDLKVRNSLPHGVLIWPTYTDTSITVTLYSTKTVTGEQTGQTTAPKGECTSVTTERTRRYVDGRTSVDKFFALYSPKEGVNCR